MIEIFHGEDFVKSRDAFYENVKAARLHGREIIKLKAKKAQIIDFKQALETNSFFADNRLVVIEKLFSQPKSKKLQTIFDYLKNLTTSADLIFWEDKKITLPKLKKVGQAKVYYFKLPAIIFQFLDTLRPYNIRQMLSLLQQLKKTEAPEMIFYMLCRHARLLILAKDLGSRGLSPMPPWMSHKFIRQSSHFSLEQLLKFHEQLLKLDYEQKTGQTLMPLDFNLDLLIAAL